MNRISGIDLFLHSKSTDVLMVDKYSACMFRMVVTRVMECTHSACNDYVMVVISRVLTEIQLYSQTIKGLTN